MEVSFSEVSRETHIPSVSAASSFAGLLYEFGENLKKDLSVCTPAIVCKYEIENGIAYVRPLVAEQEDTGSFRMKPIVRVTVMQHQYGGFYMHSPLNVGDTGWLIAADTDTDLIKERNSFVQGENSGIGAKDKTTGKPLSNQGPQISENDVLHQASQGFFIPDKWGGIQLPDELRRSLVIQQISPDQTTHGRFAIDQDGKIHILSERWREDKDKLSGGLVDIDLRFKDINPVNNQPYWSSGEIESFATAVIKGEETIKSWTDEFGKSHGGNLFVEKDVSVQGNLGVTGAAKIHGELQVDSPSLFKERVVVKVDGKAAIIDPKNDLYKTEAKFREITVVTGFKEKDENNKIVKLRAKKMRVLTDLPEDTKDVEFEVGGEGLTVIGDVYNLPFFVRKKLGILGQYEIFLPDYSLQYEGEFIEDFDGVNGLTDWKAIGARSGDVWCWITKSQDEEDANKIKYKAHFEANSEAVIKKKDGLVAYFAVAHLPLVYDNSSGQYDGITQIAAGEMVIGEADEDSAVPFDLVEKTEDNQKLIEVKFRYFYWNGRFKEATSNPAQGFTKANLANKTLWLNIDEKEKLYEVSLPSGWRRWRRKRPRWRR